MTTVSGIFEHHTYPLPQMLPDGILLYFPAEFDVHKRQPNGLLRALVLHPTLVEERKRDSMLDLTQLENYFYDCGRRDAMCK